MTATYVLGLMIAVLQAHGERVPWVDDVLESAEGIADSCERGIHGSTPEQCAAVLVEWSFHESRFQKEALHDGGSGYGLFGTHGATLGRPVPLDAAGQVDAALELFEMSWRICADHPIAERAAWYASGGSGCSKERGLAISRSRLHAAAALLREHPDM
jgi:hypothetical protein